MERSLSAPVSESHLLLIPSYNTGKPLLQTVRSACQAWPAVCVVIDGSTDGSEQELREAFANQPGLTRLTLERNQGKGAAVLEGLRFAHSKGFTHVLTMDADGQHPAWKIAEFMQTSKANPDCLILGVPQFDTSAPMLRVKGRRISNWWANLETLWLGINDSLFGFRVYPAEPLLKIMQGTRWMRRFDFDVEAVVRLTWQGLPIVNLPAPVKYLSPEEGGVSHFRYLRDNALLSWMHLRLFLGFLLRLPLLLRRKLVDPSVK
jgi:glycosyltransferase involved in cell wall biosynthesis